jgi:hypothetical protein
MAWKSRQQQEFEAEVEADNSNTPYKVPYTEKEKFMCCYGHVWEMNVKEFIDETYDPETEIIPDDLIDIATEADEECPICGTCYFIPVKIIMEKAREKDLKDW